MASLTIKELTNLRPGDGKGYLSDGNSVYGSVRHGKKGTSVSFVLKYKYDAKQKSLRLGSWPALGLKAIRDNATAARDQLTKGIDPSLDRKNSKEANKQAQLDEAKRLEAMRAGLTFGGLVDAWIQNDRVTAVKDKGAEVRRSFDKDLIPKFGTLLVKDMTRGMIAQQLDKVKARSPSIARYLLADMRSMFKWAIISEYVDADPTYLLELKKYGKKNERERVLSDAEITELPGALLSAKLPTHTEQAIWIMLSSGCRVGEISKAKWADVDLEKGLWAIPPSNSKNGRELIVQLSKFTINCFRTIQVEQARQLQAWNRPALPVHVIPSDDWTTHIDVKAISKQLKDRQREVPLNGRTKTGNKALILSTGKPWTPHDLRRTGATLMRSLGVDSDVIECCLNHVKKDTLKRIYQRVDYSRDMGKAWSNLGKRLEHLRTGQIKIVPIKNVV